MLLEVQKLNLNFQSTNSDGSLKLIPALRDIDLQVGLGESVGLVGESGSGKSLLSLSIMGLLPSNAMISSGDIYFENQKLLGLRNSEMQKIRGKKISMIFQDPMACLNPVLNLETQMKMVLEAHEGILNKQQVRDRTLDLFRQVGIPEPELKLKSFPHELSGGQAQRIMIALAMACRPQLLIADEPTTALDVTIQAQVMALLRKIQKENNLSLIFISHDLALVSQNTHRIYVLYAGEVVEMNSTAELIHNPKHPYTKALLSCLPANQNGSERMTTIPGQVPALTARPSGCQFHPRCSFVMDRCRTEKPEFKNNSRCWL